MSEEVWSEVCDEIVLRLGNRDQCALLDPQMHIWDVVRSGDTIVAMCGDKNAVMRIEPNE